jgi:hypothetical protein
MTSRHRGSTEQTADVAIDSACRLLRLPTIRSQFTELAEAAARDQMTYRSFLAELILETCEEFFAGTSPAVRANLDTLLRACDILGGPGWLIAMLALTRRRTERPAGHEQPPEVDKSAFKSRGD